MQRFTTMARPFAALLALIAAGLLATPAEAQWKWKDKGGHVQYSDLPPPSGTPEQDILGRPSGPRKGIVQSTAPASAASGTGLLATAASAPRSGDPELEAKRKKADADAAAKTRAEQEKIVTAKAENCTRAKAQLTTLDSGIRIARTNATTGEREFLDDKQRADEAKRTRDVISTDCK
jgi:hypothetical protein